MDYIKDGEHLYNYLLNDLGLRRKTAETYKYMLRRAALYFGDCEDLSNDAIKDFLSSLVDQEYSHSTIFKMKATLKHYLHIKKLDCYIPYVKVNKHHNFPRVLTTGEVMMIMDRIPRNSYQGMMDYAMVDLAYSAGLRRNEIRELRITDIHWKERFIYVRNGKGGKDRLAPLGEMLADSLNKFLEDYRYRQKSKSPMLFLTAKKLTPLSYSTMQCVNSRIRTKYSPFQDVVTLHRLRHAFACHLLENGANIESIQIMLGHSDLSSTADYARHSIKKLKKIYQKHHPRA